MEADRELTQFGMGIGTSLYTVGKNGPCLR